MCLPGGRKHKKDKKMDFKYLLTSVIVAVKIKQYYKEAENIPFSVNKARSPKSITNAKT